MDAPLVLLHPLAATDLHKKAREDRQWDIRKNDKVETDKDEEQEVWERLRERSVVFCFKISLFVYLQGVEVRLRGATSNKPSPHQLSCLQTKILTGLCGTQNPVWIKDTRIFCWPEIYIGLSWPNCAGSWFTSSLHSLSSSSSFFLLLLLHWNCARVWCSHIFTVVDASILFILSSNDDLDDDDNTKTPRFLFWILLLWGLFSFENNNVLGFCNQVFESFKHNTPNTRWDSNSHPIVLLNLIFTLHRKL